MFITLSHLIGSGPNLDGAIDGSMSHLVGILLCGIDPRGSSCFGPVLVSLLPTGRGRKWGAERDGRMEQRSSIFIVFYFVCVLYTDYAVHKSCYTHLYWHYHCGPPRLYLAHFRVRR